MKTLLITLLFGAAAYAQTSIDTPQDLSVSDENNDGFALFNLTDNSRTLIDDTDADAYRISYHLTFKDADTNANAIANPARYTNISAKEQELYARVTDSKDPSSYSVDLFTIRTRAPKVFSQEDTSKTMKASAE